MHPLCLECEAREHEPLKSFKVPVRTRAFRFERSKRRNGNCEICESILAPDATMIQLGSQLGSQLDPNLAPPDLLDPHRPHGWGSARGVTRVIRSVVHELFVDWLFVFCSILCVRSAKQKALAPQPIGSTAAIQIKYGTTPEGLQLIWEHQEGVRRGSGGGPSREFHLPRVNFYPPSVQGRGGGSETLMRGDFNATVRHQG
eukprot:1192765-Prorocentrum_minimum.AAC.3